MCHNPYGTAYEVPRYDTAIRVARVCILNVFGPPHEHGAAMLLCMPVLLASGRAPSMLPAGRRTAYACTPHGKARSDGHGMVRVRSRHVTSYVARWIDFIAGGDRNIPERSRRLPRDPCQCLSTAVISAGPSVSFPSDPAMGFWERTADRRAVILSFLGFFFSLCVYAVYAGHSILLRTRTYNRSTYRSSVSVT